MTALDTITDPEEYALGDAPRPARARRRVERATRRAEALALRLDGVSVSVIARRLDVSPRTVYAWIAEALRDIPAEQADALRALELERLDAIQVPQMKKALKGDGQAVDLVLKVMARRARLLGLDNPTTGGGLEAVGTLLDLLVHGPGERP